MNQQPDDNHADSLLNAARLIRRAGSVADVASAALRAVVSDSPRTSSEWRLRGVVRSAVECRLHRLELLLVQKTASSPEMGSDMRIEAGRHIQRVLSAIHTDRELVAQVADLAVSAVARLATASDAITRALAEARRSNTAKPQAFATMGGRLFIPAPAHEFARRHGMDEEQFSDALLRVTQPLRRACESNDVCRIGQLRYSRRLAESGVTICAELDTSTDAHAAPLIRIEFRDGADAPANQAPPQAPEPTLERYSARLLRRLVG
ncbi:MAG: hypothetical protein KDB82_15880 [Planctomycetes bacterium]|nr:hypothetical protein [Planctomycetota bacterium]